MLEKLATKGFDIAIRNHAAAILSMDFQDVVTELEDALLDVKIPAAELIESGGGEAQFTQRLRRRLNAAGWQKHKFQFRLKVDNVDTVATSHEIDHVRRTKAGAIALEIEWNNKDPFFDRDLENFQRLHAQSAISAGVLITRGASLQESLADVVRRCIEKHRVTDEAKMVEQFKMKERTRRQGQLIRKQLEKNIPFADAYARLLVNDKFSMSTTHWTKLKERIDRGVGNPCPLLLIGLPASVVEE